MCCKILVVDDEEIMRKLLRDHFETEDYLVYTADSYESTIEKLNEKPDIILLDINMPDVDGLSLCREIREFVSCPIVFLTAKITEKDKIDGLRAGGDDYITKPFSLAELSARVESHIRRQNRQTTLGEVHFQNGFVIEYDKRTVKYQNEEIIFSKREFDIIEFLSRYPNRVFEKEQIYESVWGLEADGNSDVVKEHVRKIRMKLFDSMGRYVIKTVWGVGYKWEG